MMATTEVGVRRRTRQWMVAHIVSGGGVDRETLCHMTREELVEMYVEFLEGQLKKMGKNLDMCILMM